jgi:hypothetical protein
MPMLDQFVRESVDEISGDEVIFGPEKNDGSFYIFYLNLSSARIIAVAMPE